MPVYESKQLTKDCRKYYFFCYYLDKYGKKKRHKSEKYKGIRECKRAERSFLEETQYHDINDYDIMFEDVYNEWWIFKKKTLKFTTTYCIKKIIDKHFFPFFKDYKLHSIKINIINEWLDKLENNKLVTKSKNRIIYYIKTFFWYCVYNYNFDTKVANKIQKIKEEIQVTKDNDWNFWTLEEFNTFIKVVDNDFYYLLFNFLYYTGLRIGECMALNWTDINFNRKKLRINKTLSNKVGNGSYKILPPQTKNSNRIIDLDDKLIKLLKKYYDNEKKIYNY